MGQATDGRGVPQWTEDGDFPVRRAHDPPGQRPSAAPAPELDGCTGPIGCILPLTVPGIWGMSAKTARALGCDEEEVAFRNKLRVIARQKPKDEPKLAKSSGRSPARKKVTRRAAKG